MAFLRTANPNRKCRYCEKIMPFRKRVCDDCRKSRKRQIQNKWFASRYRNDLEFRESCKAEARKKHSEKGELGRQRMRDRHRERHLEDKLAAIRRYGGKCVCCGEDRYKFLTFDHSHGDGKQHRIDVCGRDRSTSSMLIRRLRIAGWPDVPGLRILCANCHNAIDLWGSCPHGEAKAILSGEINHADINY